MTARRPPSHLSKPARDWWASVAADYILSATDLKILTEAATAWDRSQQARAILQEDGLVVRDRYGSPKAHPAVAIERDARVAFARLVRELDLEGEPLPDPRMPRRSR